MNTPANTGSWIAGQARNDNLIRDPCTRTAAMNTPANTGSWIAGQARNDNLSWIAGQARNDNLGLPDYAELHALSNFSFQRAASHAEELVERAKALSYKAIAITDECSVGGLMRAFAGDRGAGLVSARIFCMNFSATFLAVIPDAGSSPGQARSGIHAPLPQP